MFEKIKKFLKENSQSEVVKKERGIYDFEDRDEKENKNDRKLKKINFLDRIKFIKFNRKNDDKNANLHKIKEVRASCYCGCFNRSWIYKLF